MTSLHPHQLWMAAADAGYSSFDEMQEDARLKRAEQLLRERREADARRHAIEVRLRKAMAAEQGEQRRRQQFKDRIKNVLAILAFIAAILLLWQCGAFGAPFIEGQAAEAKRQLIPVEKYRDAANLYLYNRTTMPRAYQHAGGFHDPNYNISGETPERFKPNGTGGNWNIEFPWSHAAGIDSAINAGSFKFLILPGKPVIYWFESSMGCYRWRFPKGAIVGEVLTQKCPDGKERAYEVRVRIRQDRDWIVEVWRPYCDFRDLAQAIQGLRPDWRSDTQLRVALDQLTGQRPIEASFSDTNHTRPVFTAHYSRDVLPPLPAELVNELLDRVEFSEVTGATWKGDDCHAPAAESYSIVPVGYAGHAVELSNESCRRCHVTAGMDGDVVDFQRPKQKYGRICGGDGIMSFHPAMPGSISHNGATFAPDLWNIRNVMEPSRGRHNKADYQELE